jgi:uncharacterized protein YjbI with pentapeptide repeats
MPTLPDTIANDTGFRPFRVRWSVLMTGLLVVAFGQGSAAARFPGQPASGAPKGQPADTPAVRLDLEGLKARLARDTGGEPPDLSRTDLSGLDLSGLDFKKANLTGARFENAKMAGANLFACDLTDAVLTGADLTHANLDGTVLRRARLERANLQGASLFATIIEAADLSGANLSETRIIGYLRSANLSGATIRNANAGADPGNQSMGVMRATFVGADLSGADFSGTNLFKADFSHANLSGAKLAGANLENAELVQTDLTKADVTGMRLSKADLNEADFRGATGVSLLKGLDEARNKDKAIFDAK